MSTFKKLPIVREDSDGIPWIVQRIEFDYETKEVTITFFDGLTFRKPAGFLVCDENRGPDAYDYRLIEIFAEGWWLNNVANVFK